MSATSLLSFRVLQPHQQPLLGTVLAEVKQRRGFVFGQVVKSRFHDVLCVVTYRERDSLRLLVDGSLDHLRLVSSSVGVVAANVHSFPTRRSSDHRKSVV